MTATKPTVKCRKCGSTARVTRTQQMLSVDGRKRLHASCECARCRHEWWSRRRDVVAWSRQLDRAAR
jgi:hypothetical protein